MQAVRFYFLLLGVCLATFVSAQQARTVPVGNFDKLTLQGNILVELTQGDKPEIQISGENDQTGEVTVTLKGTELILKTKNMDLFEKEDRRRRKQIRVAVTYTELTQLRTGRNTEVRGKSVVTADDLEVEVHSGSQVVLDVKTTSLRLEIGEGAQATLSGTSKVQKSTVSTGGELKAENLDSEVVTIKSNTGGNAYVSASKSISASAGTGATIRYKGHPAKQDINTSLGGTISQL